MNHSHEVKMNINELYEAVDDSLYDPVDDKSYIKMNDTRRAKLTLRHLNKLRKYRVFKQSEMEQRDAIAAIIYQMPDEQEPSGGGLGF